MFNMEILRALYFACGRDRSKDETFAIIRDRKVSAYFAV